MRPNPGKKLEIEVDGQAFLRVPIKTELVTPEVKDYARFIKDRTEGLLEAGDIVFVSEKMVSIVQGRSYHIKDIKPSRLASFLSKRVYRNPGGIGLAMPETMQLAIEEAGVLRILLAAFVAALTKPLGIKGMFYRIAGRQAAAIDGPVPYAIPPYNEYASKGPRKPHEAAERIFTAIMNERRSGEGIRAAAIVDANDLGVEVLGIFPKDRHLKKFIKKALKDNPLGQTDESTPIGIIRKKK